MNHGVKTTKNLKHLLLNHSYKMICNVYKIYATGFGSQLKQMF